MAETDSDNPKEIMTDDAEGKDGNVKTKRKGKSIDSLISRVKSKSFIKKKSNASLLRGEVAKATATSTEAADPAIKKTTKKKKRKKKKPSKLKAKAKKENTSKDEERNHKDEENDDDDDEEEDDEWESSDESSGEMSIPFEIEVLTTGTVSNDDDHDLGRETEEEKESKKHESMHNSHNALRVLERADSGSRRKRVTSTAIPKRNRSTNAQEALDRVSNSKPLSDIQREAKTRERVRGQGRKRPTTGTNPHRSSSLKGKSPSHVTGIPQRTKSLDARALVNGADLTSRRTARSIDDEIDRIDENRVGSSRRTARSIDADFFSSSRWTHGSEDDIDSSKRSHRSRVAIEDLDGSKGSHRSYDRSISPDEDAELKRRAAERRAKREAQRDPASHAAHVLQRAESGKSLKEIANDSRKRRSTSAGPRRNNSKGRNQRVSVATPEGGAAAMDFLRMKEIEAQIKVEEQALKGSS